MQLSNHIFSPSASAGTLASGFFWPLINEDGMAMYTIAGQIANWNKYDHALFLDLDANPLVKGHIFMVNSMGGRYMASFSKKIANAKKPTFAFINDAACSAAYILISGCDVICADNTLSVVGSVGVMCAVPDVPGLNKASFVLKSLYADGSKDKNKEWRLLEAGKTEEAEALLMTDLNKVRDEVVAHVKSVRPQLADNAEKWDTGADFYADEALQIGLIDMIADPETFYETIKTLIK